MTLIVVSGAPGTGKSTVAKAIVAELNWPRPSPRWTSAMF